MKKIKILYVDSQDSFGKELLPFLIDANYEVKLLKTIKDAIIELSFNKPDILITDVKLVDGNGFDFIKKVQSQINDIHTILLTSDISPDVFKEAIVLKIEKVIFKTQTFKEIISDIKSVKATTNSNHLDNITPLVYLGENYFYDESNFCIKKNQEFITLTIQENTLIKELIMAQGKFIPFHNLLTSIGKKDDTTIETLRTVIRKIRKKTFNKIIHNQSGVGYKINIVKENKIEKKYNKELDKKIEVRVLILKGDKKKNELLSDRLTKLDIPCDNAYTINDAKDAIQETSYNYIIMDLNLPDGDGIDFIRDLKDLRSTKVIILSDNSDIHYKEYLYFKGIIDYIIEVEDMEYLALNIYKSILKIETNVKYNNILLIDKSKRICEQVKDILQPRNYVIDIVNDLAQAYELLKRRIYSLVILDINFENSLDFISNSKQTIDKSIPFLVLTDQNRTYEVVRDAYKSGASECLRKPIFAEEFVLKIDLIMENSKLLLEVNEHKELMQSYQNIVDKTTIVSKTDPNGVITYVNDMFCNISKYSKDELLGKAHNIVRHEDMDSAAFEDLWRTIKDERKVWNGIVKNKAKDGTPYIVQTYIMPIFDQYGTILEYMAIRYDITNLSQNSL